MLNNSQAKVKILRKKLKLTRNRNQNNKKPRIRLIKQNSRGKNLSNKKTAKNKRRSNQPRLILNVSKKNRAQL